MPIQGTASDIVKIAMIRVDDALKDAGLKTQMIMQVHDELVVRGPGRRGRKGERDHQTRNGGCGEIGRPACRRGRCRRQLDGRQNSKSPTEKPARLERFLTGIIGGDEEDRTPGLGIANAALSQLSYIPTLFAKVNFSTDRGPKILLDARR